MISLVPPQPKDKPAKPLSTRLDGDAIGQIIASLIAEHLSDLIQCRADITAACIPMRLASEAIRSQAEYEAKMVVNRLDPLLRQAAIWKAAEAMFAQVHGEMPYACAAPSVQNKYYQLARTAIATNNGVLDGSHCPLTLKDYAASAVAHAKAGAK